MKRILTPFLFFFLLSFINPSLFSQSVGINNPQPDPSAILDILSTNKGILIPRITISQRDAIPNPAQGLLVYITNDTSFHFFTGNRWLSLQSPTGGGPGGPTYVAGTGININGGQISNVGDLDPNDDVLIGSPAGGDLGVSFPNPQVTGIQGRPVENADPTEGQVLKWDGTQWSPSNDNAGDASYEAGEGIEITDTEIRNIGDTDPTNDIEIGTTAGGDLGNVFPDPQVIGIQGRPIEDADPTEGQVLKWDGTQWSPANDNAGDASYSAGEGIELTGTTITNIAPDIPISLLGEGSTSISGTYPNFIISSTDSVNDADSDPNNEMQTLILEEDTLGLSGGNRIALPRSSLWKEKGEHIYYDEGKVGISVDTPLTDFHIGDGSDVLVGDSLSGSGFKMIYFGNKGAFRVGYLNNPFGGYNYDNFWDYDSVGFYSFAAGQNSRAKGFGSFAFGSFGWADGSGSVAFFGNARGNNSFTFGGSSKGRGSITFEGTAEEEGGIAMYGYTGGRYGVSIGGGTTGLGASSSREDYAIAIGWNSDARGQASIALGPSDAYGYNSFSTGWVTEARGNYSSTFGYQTNSYPYASMALGRFNVISGDSAAWRAGDPIFIIGDGSSNDNRSNSFMIQKNGQTAIGYNDPISMLQVSTALGSINNGGALDPTHAAVLIGTETSGIAFDANQVESIGDELYLNFNSTENVRLGEGGGSLGIGINPTTRLDIKQQTDTGEGGMRLRSAASNNNFWDQYYDGNTENLTFAFNGNNRASIDAATGAYAQLSDRRVKKNIQPLPQTLEKLMQLQPVSYHYRDQPEDSGKSLGFIAQEVEALFPQLVHQQGEYKALYYSEFSVVAIQALQEQQAHLKLLQEQIEILKNQVEELKAASPNSSK